MRKLPRPELPGSPECGRCQVPRSADFTCKAADPRPPAEGAGPRPADGALLRGAPRGGEGLSVEVDSGAADARYSRGGASTGGLDARNRLRPLLDQSAEGGRRPAVTDPRQVHEAELRAVHRAPRRACARIVGRTASRPGHATERLQGGVWPTDGGGELRRYAYFTLARTRARSAGVARPSATSTTA
jgi:hypothetical protein